MDIDEAIKLMSFVRENEIAKIALQCQRQYQGLGGVDIKAVEASAKIIAAIDPAIRVLQENNPQKLSRVQACRSASA